MTTKAKTTKRQLTIGDYIGTVVMSNDIDLEDSTIWLQIIGETYIDGMRAFYVATPDGERLRMPQLQKHVKQFKFAYPDAFCDCGVTVTTDRRDCPKCDTYWFPF